MVPILNEVDLREEGRRQHHCVGSLSHSAEMGHALYFYHVNHEKEGATLAIHYRGSEWKVRELRGSCNKKVSAELNKKVGAWLIENQPSRILEVA